MLLNFTFWSNGQLSNLPQCSTQQILFPHVLLVWFNVHVMDCPKTNLCLNVHL